MLWYHPYFRYTMDFSNKDITFDCNPLSQFVAKTTLATLYELFTVMYNLLFFLGTYLSYLFYTLF